MQRFPAFGGSSSGGSGSGSGSGSSSSILYLPSDFRVAYAFNISEHFYPPNHEIIDTKTRP